MVMGMVGFQTKLLTRRTTHSREVDKVVVGIPIWILFQQNIHNQNMGKVKGVVQIGEDLIPLVSRIGISVGTKEDLPYKGEIFALKTK